MTSLRKVLAGLAFVFVAAAGGVLAPAAVAPAEAAGDCDGVWVVVGGQGTKCATAYGTGKEALRSAGFTVRDKTPGFLCQINGSPSTCTITEDQHWAYYQASRKADGTWGPWRYSQLGYTSTSPKKGDAEGWVFGAGIYGPKPPPPPAAPKPAPTSSAPKPAPTSKAPAPTSKAPAPTSKAPAPTSKAPAPTGKAAAPTSKAPAPTKAAPSATQRVTHAPSTEAAPGSGEPTPESTPAEAEPTASEPSATEPTASESPAAEPTPAPTAVATVDTAGSGTPVGAIATAGLLVAGGGALGGWMLLRRRGI